MDQQLYNAIIVFGVATLAGLGTLVTALIAWLARKLDANTRLTTEGTIASKEARSASNGRLSDALSQLARARDLVQGLRYLVRERDDRIAYIVARLPQAEEVMREYRDRRTRRATEAEERAAEEHAMSDTA